MNGVETLVVGVRWAHDLLNMVTADLTPDLAGWIPPGIANPIAAQYAHAVCSEDAIIQSLLRGGAPLFATEWKDRTGVSTPQWSATFEWARAVAIDIPALRDYAAAVAQATDTYVASLTDADLDRELDLTSFGLGRQTVGWALHALLIGHLNNMSGEISVLKGVQGAKGYPF